jgi:hypothetical protein
MIKRTSTVRRRGLTAYKVHELLMGVIKYPVAVKYYDGYGDLLADQCRDSLTENYITDEMRQDRDALMAFWRTGKCCHHDDLVEYGLNVRMLPWLPVVGSRGTLPWPARQFE